MVRIGLLDIGGTSIKSGIFENNILTAGETIPTCAKDGAQQVLLRAIDLLHLTENLYPEQPATPYNHSLIIVSFTVSYLLESTCICSTLSSTESSSPLFAGVLSYSGCPYPAILL